jgi:hypothetical protein
VRIVFRNYLQEFGGTDILINNADTGSAEKIMGALVMFSKCLANEVIGDNIQVNTINAGRAFGVLCLEFPL